MKKRYNMNKLSLIAVVFMMIFVAFSSIDFINPAKAGSGTPGDDDGGTCPPEGCEGGSGTPVDPAPDDDDDPPTDETCGYRYVDGLWVYMCGEDLQAFDKANPEPSLNEPPVADNDAATINEDTTSNQINVLLGDSDPDGDTLTISSVGSALFGATSQDGDYVYYTPNANYFGSDQFTYTIFDGQGGQDTGTVSMTINNINDAPVVGNIGDQIVFQGSSFATIDLDNYVSDIDNTDDQMIWTYTGNQDLTVSIVNRVATISIPAEWYGLEDIRFIASDPGSSSDNDESTFTVELVLPDIITYVNAIDPVAQVGSLLQVTATLERGVISGMVLYYRYSTDESTWSGWTQFGYIDSVAPYSWNFNYPAGSGYYEFYSIGKTTV